MMNPNELRTKRTECLEKAKAIRDGAKAADRDLTEDETAKLDDLLNQADQYKAEAERIEAAEAREARLNDGLADLTTSQGRQTPPDDPGQANAGGGLPVGDVADIFVGGPRHGRLRAFVGPNERQAEAEAYASGQFLMGVLANRDDPRRAQARQWCQDHGLDIQAAQTGGTVGGGGATVPTILSNRVIDIIEQFGVFRRECTVEPMTSDTQIIPRRTGGLTAYFVGDADATTASTTAWNNVELVAREMSALALVPISLMDDSIMNWADRIALEMGRAFAEKEDDCGFNGDGTSTYGGIVGVRTKMVDGNHDGSYVDATVGDDQFAELLAADLVTVIGTVPDYAGIQEKWYGSKLAWGTAFLRLLAAAGGNTAFGLTQGVAKQYLGYDYVTSSKMPKVTTALNELVMLLFGDLAMACTFGSRNQMTIRTSDQRYFEYRQIGILGTERFDIVVHDIGDDTTPGPLVGLRGNTS